MSVTYVYLKNGKLKKSTCESVTTALESANNDIDHDTATPVSVMVNGLVVHAASSIWEMHERRNSSYKSEGVNG